ncbi:riboflavin synthase [Pontibacter beigongshangensis]|uniref:riboflavin synthase n=1 Tax=Pontibacter beigongshangensis TaxID=2574733 RepID=UPI001650219D|nr:riboflavin synthase [Pontibacter beigongshangensis]
MFTGIIEAVGKVEAIRAEHTNKHFTITCPFTAELQIDQSVAHNGICMTVVGITGNSYTVTAIDETLKKTNLNKLAQGDLVNLERCMQANGRFDGHVVQGHVDQTAICESVTDENGSWLFTFSYDAGTGNVTVEKGSICVNGISLTVVNSQPDRFSVAIIPYTYEHTNLQHVRPGDSVNLEFDIIGKYVKRLLGQ